MAGEGRKGFRGHPPALARLQRQVVSGAGEKPFVGNKTGSSPGTGSGHGGMFRKMKTDRRLRKR